METDIFLMALAGLTLLAIVIFALTSKKKVVERKHDDSVPKSSLAADGDSHRRVD